MGGRVMMPFCNGEERSSRLRLIWRISNSKYCDVTRAKVSVLITQYQMGKSRVTPGMPAGLLWSWGGWCYTCPQSCILALSSQCEGSLYFCNSSGDSFGLTQSWECLSNHVHTQNRWLSWEAGTTVQHVRNIFFFHFLVAFWLEIILPQILCNGNSILILSSIPVLFSFSCQAQEKHFSHILGVEVFFWALNSITTEF